MSEDSKTQRMDSSESLKKSKHKDKHKHKGEDRGKKRKADTDEPHEKHKHHKHKAHKHSHTSSSTTSSALAASNARFPTTLANSPFATRKTSFYVPLAPIAQADPLAGACAEHLSPLILTYSSTLDGIVLSYSGASLSDHPHAPPNSSSTKQRSSKAPIQRLQYAQAHGAYAAPFAWVTAEFLILRVDRGVVMEGEVNVQSENHIGLICWNLFSASIERKRLPRDWKYRETSTSHNDGQWAGQDGDGTWSTAENKPIRGLVKFRVVDFETKGDGFMRIEGSLLSDEEEEALLRKEREAEPRTAQGNAPR